MAEATNIDWCCEKKYRKGDVRFIIKDIARYVGITSAAAQKLLTEYLGLMKLCARLVPNFFAKEQKAYRDKMCHGITQNVKIDNKKKSNKLLNGLETSIYYFNLNEQ